MLRRLVIAAAFAVMPAIAPAQTVHQLNHQPPDGAIMTFQLTDGTVLAQGYGESDFWILTPDNTGSYVNGTWKQAASLASNYEPYAMASQVLADGRVLIEGGEYNFGVYAFTGLGAIYDPLKNAWTKLKGPGKGFLYIGDSGSSMLPDGTFLLAEKMNRNVAKLDPKTMQWTILSHKGKAETFNSEEGLTLLPDGTVLVVDVQGNPNTEIYDPVKQKWQSAGDTPVNLQGPPCCSCITYGKHNKCYNPPGEVGPAILMPDGTVFATGATHSGENTAHTAIYTPGSGWTAGPDFPNGDQAGDDYAALLPNGHAIVEGNSGTLYEWDGKNLTRESQNGEGGSLMMLPSGELLIGGFETYTSSGTYKSAWQPTISISPSTVTRGSTYQISGTQFNGLSQAAAFGDEFQMATNYPLVRITNNSTGHVFYAHTHDHSTMGVATGNTPVSTNFDVPSSMETGASSLVVVANGIPSNPVSVTVQ